MEGESLLRLQNLLCDKERLIDAITKLLGDLLAETQGLPRQATAFDCKQIPAIAIRDYLRRIISFHSGISKYANCSESVLVAALILMDRFQERI